MTDFSHTHYRIRTAEDVAIGATSAASSGTAGPGDHAVFLAPDANCHVRIGPATPTAVATDTYLAGNTTATFRISDGDKVAVIQEGAATGQLNVSFLTL